jgi:hypothetical protein
VPAPATAAAGHEKSWLGKIAGEISPEHIVHFACHPGNDGDAGSLYHPRKGARYGTADEHLYVEFPETPDLSGEEPLPQRDNAPVNLFSGVRIHQQELLGRIENGRNPVSEYGYCDSHCRTSNQQSAEAVPLTGAKTPYFF